MEGGAHSQSLALPSEGKGNYTERERAYSSLSPVLNHPTNRLRRCSCAPSCALALSHGNAVCHLHDDLSPPGMKEDNQAPFFPKAVARLPLPLSLSLRQTIVDFCDGRAFLPSSSSRARSVGPTVQSGVPLEDSGGDGAVALFAESPRAHTHKTHARERHKAVRFFLVVRGNGELFLLYVRIVICNKTIINADRVS